MIETAEEQRTYTYEEALELAKEYFNGSELEASTFLNKYALKDNDDNILEATPDQMHQRLAKELARIEQKYPSPLSEKEIYNQLKGFGKIIAQGSPMAGIGNPYQIMSLSNCFVTGSNQADSYGGIMYVDETLAQLMKRRAGVGTDLSHLRPSGTTVRNASRSSTGAVSFMHRYSNTTREVAQEGRRGALMISLDVRHPDIFEFISIKNDEQSVTGANISIRFRDDFMEAVKKKQLGIDEEFTLRYPISAEVRDGLWDTKITEERNIDPINLWNKFIDNTWRWAEPSGLFWDTILKESIPDCYADLGFRTTSTNPCGEIPLCEFDSCRLLLVNLFEFVKNPFTEDAHFDFTGFKKTVSIAQKLMDDIVDLELEQVDKIINKIKNDPEPENVKRREVEIWEKIKEKAEQGRRTGTGITAMGDMIAGMGLTYGTDEATEFADQVMRIFKQSAYKSSVNMADQRGAFPMWDHEREKDNPFLNRIREEDSTLYENMKQLGRRNISLLTIAPAGTTSMMAQTTSGIENLFAPYYFRKKKINPNDQGVRTDFVDASGDHWMEFPVFHKRFEQYLEVNGHDMSDVREMSEDELDNLVEKSPYYNATTKDVDWVKKVEMQGKIQKHIDHSISVTTNLPEDASKETVERVYMKAWESGCKGCTIYREGSRSDVLSTKSTKDKEEGGFKDNHAPKRPKRLECDVHHFINNGEKWLAFVGMLDGRPYEVFAGKESAFDIPTTSVTGEIVKEKNNGDSRYDYHYTHYNKPKVAEGLSNVFDREYWNYAKFVSMTLRHGAPIQYVVDVLNGLELEQDHISTWKRGLARILKKYIPEDAVIKDESINPECPDEQTCEIVMQEGCKMCKTCGYSACT